MSKIAYHANIDEKRCFFSDSFQCKPEMFILLSDILNLNDVFRSTL